MYIIRDINLIGGPEMKRITTQRRVGIHMVYRKKRKRATIVVEMPLEVGPLVRERIEKLIGKRMANGRKS